MGVQRALILKYLLVLTTATLAATKVSLQSLVAKGKSPSTSDRIFYTMLMFFAASLLFLPYIFTATATVWLYAAIYAVCNGLFQILYISSLSRGNVSLTVMLANFGVIIPIGVSCLFYGESPSVLRIVGICLIFLVFVLNVKGGTGAKRGYYPLVIAAMITNGISTTVQKVFSRTGGGEGIFSFVSAGYLLAALFCCAIFLLISRRGRVCERMTVTKRAIFASIGAGIALSVFLVVNVYAAGVIDGSFQYPAHAGGSILLSTLAGVLFFKDRLGARQTVACLIGLVAIVFMNF